MVEPLGAFGPEMEGLFVTSLLDDHLGGFLLQPLRLYGKGCEIRRLAARQNTFNTEGVTMMKKKITTRQIVMAGMLSAITVVLSATGIGFIPVPTVAGRATFIHVPVILAGVLEGPLVAAFTGFIFGLYSFLTPTGVIPADPIVRILPRIFIGVVAYYVYRVCGRHKTLGAALAADRGNAHQYAGLFGPGGAHGLYAVAGGSFGHGDADACGNDRGSDFDRSLGQSPVQTVAWREWAVSTAHRRFGRKAGLAGGDMVKARR